KSWPQKHRIVGDVRERGLMIAVEIVKDKQLKTPAGLERDHIIDLAFEHSMLFLGCGETSIRLSPPLIITKEQAKIAMDMLEKCINIVERSTPSSETHTLVGVAKQPVNS